MKTLIIYDSVFGNTGKIAQNIYNSFKNKDEVKICHIDYAELRDLENIDLLIIGSPTRGFRPTELISKFIKGITSYGLIGIKTAVFDTRLCLSEINSSLFRFIVKNGGYAASTIDHLLQKKGGKSIVTSEGFLVNGEKGPLKEGELERASSWLNKILISYTNQLQTNSIL